MGKHLWRWLVSGSFYLVPFGSVAADTIKITNAVCYLSDYRQEKTLQFGAADNYIKAARECGVGDVVYIDQLPPHQLNYLAANICDFRFEITPITVTEEWANLSCIYSGEKYWRQK